MVLVRGYRKTDSKSPNFMRCHQPGSMQQQQALTVLDAHGITRGNCPITTVDHNPINDS